MLRLLADQAAVAIENARLHDNLEGMVEIRTQQLGEAQRRITAAERLAAANAVSNELAHRLSNAAGTIPVRVDMARSLLDPIKDRDRAIVRMLDSIKSDIQGLSSAAEALRRGSSGFHVESMDVNALVSSTLANIYVPPSIKLIIDLSPALPPIRASADHLSETLKNLISNAVDAMPNGGELRLHTGLVTLEGRECVQLEVTDTGQGIAPEEREKIFQLFYTTKPNGLGYGLWRDRNLAEQLGGKLEVDSQPGQGATFILILPAARQRQMSSEL